jgi:hypothetical protein
MNKISEKVLLCQSYPENLNEGFTFSSEDSTKGKWPPLKVRWHFLNMMWEPANEKGDLT